MKISGVAVCCVFALVTISAAFRVSAGPAAPVGLLVNGVSNPPAIDRDATRFTWMSTDARRGESQTAYQILVASSLKRIAADTGDLWDSGKVASDKSASVEYAGKAL